MKMKKQLFCQTTLKFPFSYSNISKSNSRSRFHSSLLQSFSSYLNYYYVNYYYYNIYTHGDLSLIIIIPLLQLLSITYHQLCSVIIICAFSYAWNNKETDFPILSERCLFRASDRCCCYEKPWCVL